MKERFKSYLFIIIISVIVSIPLFNSNFDIYIDDGIQHVCRLMGTYQSITEGQTFPVIMSNFCNNFGYSWNIFYSPITAYVPLLFKIFTDSFIVCLKAFMVLITILSGISMYEFLFKVTKNKYVGILGSAIYIFAPYRLTDMYTRIAIAELASFVFLPMIFQGLYTIFQDDENDHKASVILLSTGAIGLILSHTVIAMYTAIFGLIYVLINLKKLRNKSVLKKLLISLIFIITITCFFWAPLLEHKLNTQYEVFKEGRMERTEVLIAYKLDLLNLIYTKDGNFCFEIGLITIIGLILTILSFKKIEDNNKKIYIFSLISGIISIFMTLKCFPFEKLPSILKMLQFSFRMLEFSSFFLSFVVAINYEKVIKNFKTKDLIILVVITILLVIPLTKNLRYTEKIDENNLWPAVPVTQNTGRVHAGCASFEYLPSKAFENLDYLKNRENKVIVLEGSGEIVEEQKSGTNLKAVVKNVRDDTIIELPYIYYLGYNARFENNGEISNLEITESDNGFLQVKLKAGEEGTLNIEYTGTNIMKLSAGISFIAFSVMLVYACFSYKYLRKGNL